MNQTEDYSPPGALDRPPRQLSQPADDPRVTRALEEYRALLDAGDRPDREKFLERHPGIAADLSECLAGLEFIYAVAPHLSEAVVGADTSTVRVKTSQPLGDFHIHREIGRGGMGIVYEAEQLSLGRRVALKVLPFAAAMDSKQLQRFKNEAQAAAHLHHQNIVPVYAVGCERGVHYYAMQFIEGQTLAEVIRELHEFAGMTPVAGALDAAAAGSLAKQLVSGRWAPIKPITGDATLAASSPLQPPAADISSQQELLGSTERSTKDPAVFRTVAHLGIQAAEALEHAHQMGVIHRDIKPANMLVDACGKLWITDFGLAHCQTQANLTMSGDIVGTLRYMSPEQALAQRVAVDQRTDIYSLGVTLYEMLALRPAFEGNDRQELLRQIAFEEPRPLRAINRAIPAELETIVLKAAAKNPAERFASAQELADDLRRFLDDQPILAKRPTLYQRARKLARRHKAVVWTSLVGVMLILLSTVGLLTISRGQIEQERDKALDEQQKAERAERGARLRLFEARRAQARASRYSRQIGQRFESLKAITEAVQLARDLDLDKSRMMELRNEAIASLALADLRPLKEWEGWPAGSSAGFAFDANLERYARSDLKGNISIRRVSDEVELGRLSGGGPGGGGSGASNMCFSPNGELLAISYWHLVPGTSTNFLLWDWQRGKIILQPSFVVVESTMGFSNDGKRLALGQANGSITLFNTAAGREEKQLHVRVAPYHLVFSPSGDRLAVCCHHSEQVKILDVNSGRLTVKVDPPSAPTYAAWHPRHDLLAVGTQRGQIYIWNATTGAQYSVLEGHQNPVMRVGFMPGGDLLHSASWDETGRLWDPSTGEQLLSHSGVWGQFSRDGHRLVSRNGPMFALHAVADGREYRALPAGPQGRTLADGDVSPDGRWLIAGGHSGLGLWDLSTGSEQALLPLGTTTAGLFHPSGHEFYSSGNAGLWRWPIQPNAATLAVGPPRKLAYDVGQRICLDKEGRRMAAGDGGQGGRVIDLEAPAAKTPPRFKHEEGLFVAFSPNGKWVATGTWNGFGIKVWESETGKELRHLLPDLRISRVAFSPDGRRLVTSVPKEFAFWQAGSWQLERQISRIVEGDSPGCIAFNAETQTVALGMSRDTVELRHEPSGQALALLQAPTKANTNWMGFTPDGSQLVVIIGTPGRIRIWDLRLIRAQLRAIGLDWEPALPAPPAWLAASQRAKSNPVAVKTDLGDFKKALEAHRISEQGLVHLRAQRWEKALAELTKAVALAPDDVDNNRHCAWLNAKLKRWDKAADAYGKVADLLMVQDPDDAAIALYDRALAHIQARRFKEAHADYLRALELRPASDLANNNLAWFLVACEDVKFHDPARAVMLAKKAVELAPDDGVNWSTLGTCYYRAGQWQPAVEVIDKSLKLLGERYKAFNLFFLAMAHWQLGNKELALKHNEQARQWMEKNSPNDEELRRFRAEAAALLGLEKRT